MKACLAYNGSARALRGGASNLWRAGALVALGLVSLGLGACGDDDAAARDGGTKKKDAGTDAGQGHYIPRPDAQVTSGDPVPTCDRFDPLACGGGQHCRLVIRAQPGQTQFSIYSGCISGVDERSEGDPCDPWGGMAQPYEAEGLQDDVFVDPCAAGLFCAPDPKIRNHGSCQRACEPETNVTCPMSDQYCAPGGQTQLEQYCRAGDMCDPHDPTSCGQGNGCYLHLNDAGDSVLTVCLPAPTMSVKDGEACMHYNDCVPGSSCWGPTRVPPNRWQNTDLICRRSCSDTGGGGGQDDGGADEDGGTGGICPVKTKCVDFKGSGLDLGGVKNGASLGQCE
jgi:hypothetical protein